MDTQELHLHDPSGNSMMPWCSPAPCCSVALRFERILPRLEGSCPHLSKCGQVLAAARLLVKFRGFKTKARLVHGACNFFRSCKQPMSVLFFSGLCFSTELKKGCQTLHICICCQFQLNLLIRCPSGACTLYAPCNCAQQIPHNICTGATQLHQCMRHSAVLKAKNIAEMTRHGLEKVPNTTPHTPYLEVVLILLLIPLRTAGNVAHKSPPQWQSKAISTNCEA